MIVFSLFLTSALGWLLVPSGWRLAAVPRLGVAFGAGAAALSFELFAYGLAGIGFSAGAILAPWALLAAWFSWRDRGRLTVPLDAPERWWHVALLALSIIPVAVWLPYERLMPFTVQSWDAWAIWLFKAKAFYLDGTFAPYLAHGGTFVNHPGYPLLTPLYGVYLYALNGGVEGHEAKLLSPFFFGALLALGFHLSRRMTATGPVPHVFTVMLAATPMTLVVAFGWAGYADTALAFYVLAAGGFLSLWWRSGERADLIAASCAAAAAAWTKNEGQFFLLGVMAISALRLLRERRPLAEWAWLIAPSAVVLVPWILLRRSYGIEAAEFVPGVGFDAGLFVKSAQTLLRHAFTPGSFNLTWWFFGASLVAAARWRLPLAFWITPSLAAWHVLGALLSYATGRNDIDWWLATSADRVLAQAAPLALLPAAMVFGQWWERDAAEADKTASPLAAAAGRKKKRR